MSQRDRRLLDEAGINIVTAAEVFGRSRQALYTGLAHERDYFSPQDVITILNDAQRRDFGGLGKLIRFVEANYADQRDIIVPERIGFAQLERVIDDAQRVIMTTNGNQDHFRSGANFAKIYADVLQRRPETLRIMLPSQWVVYYMEQNPALRQPIGEENIVFRSELAYLPSFVAVEDKAGRRRVFMLGRVGVEELLPDEAEKLCIWEWAKKPGDTQATEDVSAGDGLRGRSDGRTAA